MEHSHSEVFEKQLVEKLAHEMDKSQLSSMTKSIASSGNLAFLIDWTWKGTPAFWDIVNLVYQVPVSEFNAASFLKNDIINELRIIRKGIPNPNIFQIEATIRNSHRGF